MGRAQASKMKFCADRNLGRLAKWLRILGFDTKFMRDSTQARLLAERQEGRIVLTRITSLRGAPGVVFVAANDPREQLARLAAELDLAPEARLSRCPVCNLELVAASPSEVEAAVPEHVRLVQRKFHRCASCGRIYWPGSHVARMRERLAGLIAGGEEKTSSEPPRLP
jgi:uncharacterized protein with PIN domain